MLILSNLLSFIYPLYCDASYPWQIGFQDGSTPNFEGIVELHDTIFFYLVVISFLVFWMLAVIMIKFSSSKVGIVHKYHNHGVMRPGVSLRAASTGHTSLFYYPGNFVTYINVSGCKRD
jgi:heme/copper-type cytochrome/quinol oxidase subunit 2